MKLKDIGIIDVNGKFLLAYGDKRNSFCTEMFEYDSPWCDKIIEKYGDVEIESIYIDKAFYIMAYIFIDKQTCFDISYEIMNTIMIEDVTRQETA